MINLQKLSLEKLQCFRLANVTSAKMKGMGLVTYTTTSSTFGELS